MTSPSSSGSSGTSKVVSHTSPSWMSTVLDKSGSGAIFCFSTLKVIVAIKTSPLGGAGDGFLTMMSTVPGTMPTLLGPVHNGSTTTPNTDNSVLS